MTVAQLNPSPAPSPVRQHVEMIHRLADGVDGVLVVSVFNARLASDNGIITRHPVGDIDGMLAAIEAHKDRVRNVTNKLRKDHLVEYKARKWKLTAGGKEAVADVRAQRLRNEQIAGFAARASAKRAVHDG